MGKEDRKKVVLLPNIVRIFLPPNPLQIVSTRDWRQLSDPERRKVFSS